MILRRFFTNLLSLSILATPVSAAVVTRGPYLQLGTPESTIVRWRTDIATDSCVRYGATIGTLTSLVCDPAVTTEHIVTVDGLSPNTRYYYSVGTTEGPLAGDSRFYIETSPNVGEAIPTRIWVLGDSGTANSNQVAVRNAYTAFVAGGRTNFILMLGDNAYPGGTDSQYQGAVFGAYPNYLRKTVLWPTLGNHDGISADSATQTGPYYNVFTLPTNGEAGGLASGTEAYYSFDYGNLHLICLESYETDRSPTSAMMTWLQQDALATSQQWVIAFWHHPPYSKGSHDSDAEVELIEMRENALPILEQAGVDLVLTGHSHSYERSFLIDGHYGLSATFSSAMMVDGGNGQVGGSGAYKKPTQGPASHEGTVYVVAGSSGQVSGGALDHPAMFFSLNQLGSLVLDVDGRRLDARFLEATGAISDSFTLFKGSPPEAQFTFNQSSGAAPLSVAFTDTSQDDPTAWAWDFNGDNVPDSAAQNPSNLYSTPGIYTVSLTASNLAGADTESKPNLICATSANGLSDVDGDAIVDGVDLCPCAADPLQENADGDGLGNACDPDDDNDGSVDFMDCAPLDATHSAPPPEVGMSVTLGPEPEQIAWSAVPQTTFYNVYRGLLPTTTGFSYTHTCQEPHTLDAVSSDPELPELDTLFFYLVSAGNSCAQGPLGFDSSGSPRPYPSPCP
jgi:PKD repeat protein